jgi:hypothetical protein
MAIERFRVFISTKGRATMKLRDPLATIRRLVYVSRGDTVYRDIYLERGASLLASWISMESYRVRKAMRQEFETLIRKNVDALARGNWLLARELTDRMRGLKQSVEENEELLKVAQEVYDPEEFVLDPFSPGLTGIGGNIPPDSMNSILEELESLAKEDPERRPFYSARASMLSGMRPGNAPVESAGAKGRDVEELKRKAISAALSGNLDLIDRIVGEIDMGGAGAPELPEARFSSSSRIDLSPPFPEETVRRGGEIGFVPAVVEAYPEIAAHLHRWAWQPALPDPLIMQDGHIRITGIPDDRGYPAETPKHLLDGLDLFLIQPFVNSCGVRYLPQLVAESLLVEEFPEKRGEAGEGELLAALALKKRWGLSRREIERALLARGPQALSGLFGLDPARYRLVCIPPDIYTRLGERFGWGRGDLWTHFDGYQLLKDGRARALVGGDVRYGGIFDLCSISGMDEREGVVARFAVVRRERLAAV